MGLHVGLEGLLIPRWIRDEGHKRVCPTDMGPIHSAQPVQLDLQMPKGCVKKCQSLSDIIVSLVTKRVLGTDRECIDVMSLDLGEDALLDRIAGGVE